MIDVEREGKTKFAFRLTWISAISFLLGGAYAWFLVSEGGPEALGVIIPMMAVGAIHIVLGPMVVLYAFKSRQFKNKNYIYLYFAFYFVATIVILSGEALVYSALFFVAMITPLLVAVVVSLIRVAKKQ